MSPCRPAFRRIAFALVITTAALATASRSKADSLFGDDAAINAYPIDHSASQAALDELKQARLTLTRARIAAAQIQRSVEHDLQDAGGYRGLQFAALQGVATFNATRRPVLANLTRDPEYAALIREREATRAEIRRVADERKSQYVQLVPLARRALAAGERISRSESIVLALEPSVEDAREAMTDAFAKLRRVEASIHERAVQGPEVVGAREDVAAARDRVTRANANLAAALRAEAAVDQMRRG